MSQSTRTDRRQGSVTRHSAVRQTGVRAPSTRISERRASAGGSRRSIISALLLLASLGLLGLILSGAFRVRHVNVVGAGLPRAQIVQASGVVGENVFSVRSDQVVNRLNGVSQISVQRVDTSLPGNVTIYARLRIAMVGWRRGKELFLLDTDGHVTQQVATTRLPIITSAGGTGELGPGIVVAVREAVRLVPAAPHGAIAGFQYDPRNGLTISGVTGWRAILGTGSPQTLVTRVATLVDLLKSTQSRPFQTVDLRSSSPFASFNQ